ncbi:hypothetical protein B566_EDAN017863 [Ephemera danica]|nr:hypothetical protein B566_EDAN017863 [Ephemera danica]
MAQNEAVLQKIATSNAEFSRNFYKVLQAHEGNLVASPLSAQLVLVLVVLAQLGARGRTAEQMKVGLALPEDVETGCEKVILEIANRMYVKTGFGIEADFVAAAEKTFNSTVESVDFMDPAVRILNELTRLVLVNAVYFKGPWLHSFNPKHTRPQPFYTDDTHSVEVPFMYKKADFGYASVDSLDAEIVELPYQLSLVIVLPKSRTGLAALETKMQDQKLSDLLKNIGSRELELFLPNDNADFSGISPVALKVSHVLQKTFIEVSEEGTEAAAATGFTVCPKKVLAVIYKERRKRIPVKSINHPFAFVLKTQSVVVFSGRVLRFDMFALEVRSMNFMLTCTPVRPPRVTVDHAFLFFLVSRASAVLFGGRVVNPKA